MFRASLPFIFRDASFGYGKPLCVCKVIIISMKCACSKYSLHKTGVLTCCATEGVLFAAVDDVVVVVVLSIYNI